MPGRKGLSVSRPISNEPNLSHLSIRIGCVTAVKLREWRGVKPTAGPSGVAINTRLRTTRGDVHVLDLVATHLGRLRRADLAAVTRPQPLEQARDGAAAATVIGRRAQGFRARRREGVTCTRPEDRVVRATDQAAPDDRQVSTSYRHRPGIRGTESRPPSRASTRHLGRATVIPARPTTAKPHQYR